MKYFKFKFQKGGSINANILPKQVELAKNTIVMNMGSGKSKYVPTTVEGGKGDGRYVKHCDFKTLSRIAMSYEKTKQAESEGLVVLKEVGDKILISDAKDASCAVWGQFKKENIEKQVKKEIVSYYPLSLPKVNLTRRGGSDGGNGGDGGDGGNGEKVPKILPFWVQSAVKRMVGSKSINEVEKTCMTLIINEDGSTNLYTSRGKCGADSIIGAPKLPKITNRGVNIDFDNIASLVISEVKQTLIAQGIDPSTIISITPNLPK